MRLGKFELSIESRKLELARIGECRKEISVFKTMDCEINCLKVRLTVRKIFCCTFYTFWAWCLNKAQHLASLILPCYSLV